MNSQGALDEPVVRFVDDAVKFDQRVTNLEMVLDQLGFGPAEGQLAAFGFDEIHGLYRARLPLGSLSSRAANRLPQFSGSLAADSTGA